MECEPDDSVSDDQVTAFFARLDAMVEGELASALVHLDTAPTAIKELDPWTLARADVLRSLDGPNVAVAWLESVVKRCPEFADAHHLLGAWLMDLGSTEIATRHWLQTLKLDCLLDLVSESADPSIVASLEVLARTTLASGTAPQSGSLAGAKVRVAPRPSEQQVQCGMDPRACVAITTPSSHQGPPGRELGEGPSVWLFTQCLWANSGLDETEMYEEVPTLLSAELERYLASGSESDALANDSPEGQLVPVRSDP